MSDNIVRPTEIILFENSRKQRLTLLKSFIGKGFYCDIYICESIDKLISIVFRKEEYINFARPEIILINEQLYIENQGNIDEKKKIYADLEIKNNFESTGEIKIFGRICGVAGFAG
jgi:hypothetical protein